MSDVSVIVPVRDGERYLGEALESILGQTRPPAEVIVVDDGSTDGTPAVAAGFGSRVRYLRQAPARLAAAMNLGMETATGRLIASLDADDVWAPDKLALQVAALDADPGLDIVFGHVENFHSPELSEAERASVGGATGQLVGHTRGAMLARREAMDRVGPFETRWRLGEFLDWQARAIDAGLRMTVLPEVVMRRRMHLANDSRLAVDARSDYARVLRATLDRRRARAGGRAMP